MAGLYGIADFAKAFNDTRDKSLFSGWAAKNVQRADYLADYQLPEHMAYSDKKRIDYMKDAQTLGLSYPELVQAGIDRNYNQALGSRIDLQKTEADNHIEELRAQAMANGIVDDIGIAKYISSNVDPIRAMGNPYLSSAIRANQEKIDRQQQQFGLGVGGSAGLGVANEALSRILPGWKLEADENGNVYYVDPNGETSYPVQQSAATSLGTAQIDGGAAMTKYYGAVEKDRAHVADQLHEIALQEMKNQSGTTVSPSSALTGLGGTVVNEPKLPPLPGQPAQQQSAQQQPVQQQPVQQQPVQQQPVQPNNPTEIYSSNYLDSSARIRSKQHELSRYKNQVQNQIKQFQTGLDNLRSAGVKGEIVDYHVGQLKKLNDELSKVIGVMKNNDFNLQALIREERINKQYGIK